MSTKELFQYEDIRDHLRVRLVDIRTNGDMLRNAIFETVGCGYALVACAELSETVMKGGYIRITRNLAEKNGIDQRVIMQDAMRGSQTEHTPKLCPILDVLMGTEDHDLLKSGEKADAESLLVLTTKDGYLGASALFYPEMTRRIGEIVGGDYFVLPSSVHEVLIYPDNGTMKAEELAQMVQSINESEVQPEERLGNRVLHYRRDLERLQVAADMDRETNREKERG